MCMSIIRKDICNQIRALEQKKDKLREQWGELHPLEGASCEQYADRIALDGAIMALRQEITRQDRILKDMDGSVKNLAAQLFEGESAK